MFRGTQLVGFGSRQSSAIQNPVDIFGTGCHAWWDGADSGQITLNTTPDPDTVSSWVSKGQNAFDIVQATEANQPQYNAAGGYLTFDSTDLLNGTANLTALTGHTLWVLLRRTGTQNFILFRRTSAVYIGVAQNGNGGQPDASSGTPTYYFDGGSAMSPDDRNTFYDSFVADTDQTIEINNLSFASWSTFQISGYASFEFTGRIYDVVITDNPTAGERTSMLAYLNSRKP